MRYSGRRYYGGYRRKITPEERKRQLKIALIFLITGILLFIILNRKEIIKFIKKNKNSNNNNDKLF
jgi:hypothetical protein